MTNQELFKQAIADAKSVRDAAVANAKAALEETFTPRIMDMLSAKLNELEEEGLEEKKEVEEEGYGTQDEGHEAEIGFGAAHQKPEIEGKMEEDDSMEETDLEEILAQLEAEEKMKEEGKEEVEEAKDEVEEGKKDMEEAKKKEVEEAKKKDDKKEKVEESLEEAGDDKDEAGGDDEVTELTVDELKDIIRDVLKDVMGGAGDEEELDVDAKDELGDDDVPADGEGDDISLDELLSELEKEEEGKKVEEKKEVEEGKEEVEEAKKEVEEAKKKEMEEAKKDLEEAIATIKTLRAEINEVNLLNAKLLYTNKIFKAKSLNEAQKVKVLKAFDKAKNVKEAKLVYESLSESFTTKTKNTIKESVGFASKAAGIAPAQPIVESDSAIRRMQQLAGIIK